MASIIVDFIYQITFYTAVMAIAGKYEMEKEKKHRGRHTLSIQIGVVETPKSTQVNGVPQQVNFKQFFSNIDTSY